MEKYSPISRPPNTGNSFKATAPRLSVDIPANPSSIISRDHHDNAELPFQVDVVILDSWILYHGSLHAGLGNLSLSLSLRS